MVAAYFVVVVVAVAAVVCDVYFVLFAAAAAIFDVAVVVVVDDDDETVVDFVDVAVPAVFDVALVAVEFVLPEFVVFDVVVGGAVVVYCFEKFVVAHLYDIVAVFVFLHIFFAKHVLGADNRFDLIFQAKMPLWQHKGQILTVPSIFGATNNSSSKYFFSKFSSSFSFLYR